ncbi:hypothetical protein EVAR_33972_1 [Eumeta japonica]|uniref:Chitin-binding type-2 domain-containing protein n=1 Tax=Eumeta variegata TaxID=151549 RepID=A0A4C1WZE8_EUMVA|nr:hypothetical protein EVAR_33972_1 [Eumeta japonica]
MTVETLTRSHFTVIVRRKCLKAIIGRGSCSAKKAPDNSEATVAVVRCANGQNYYRAKFECGPYGFICENGKRLRLCDDDRLYGPAFLCPENTLCNEATNDVCESTVNHIEPTLSKAIRCNRNERIADPTVPGCKGYILCIPNKNRFQGIKFKCAGNTIFNGVSRTCSAPDRYKCPLGNNTKFTDFFREEVRRAGVANRNDHVEASNDISYRPRPIDCKNYKFSVRQEGSPVGRVAYFCPPRPVSGDTLIRCTVFSNQFCITLAKEEEDQFAVSTGFAHRKPRFNKFLT